MYPLLRPILFSLPPETAHLVTLKGLDLAYRLGMTRLLAEPVAKPVEWMGLRLLNPVGLAAGLDKNAEHIDSLGALGFGFIEVGTVTPRPQPGNLRPRLFRLKKSHALINRMGFNNSGLEALIQKVKKRRYPGILGINIGKNFDTELESAAEDYLIGMESVYPFADYISVNISSPNTPGLRSLQNKNELAQLMSRLVERRRQLAGEFGKKVPLAVKIAPDMNEDALRELADTLVEAGVDGIIATNTTISRDNLPEQKYSAEKGGLSGAPLKERSTLVVACLADHLKGALPIVAVGGIESAQDAQDKLAAGAKAVQVYTGLIYRGPSLPTRIAKALKV